MVQFCSWFKIYFLLFQTLYHKLPYPKTIKNKSESKDKIEPQHPFADTLNQKFSSGCCAGYSLSSFHRNAYSALINFIRIQNVIGHFGVVYGTGASFKFKLIDKLTPPHNRSC